MYFLYILQSKKRDWHYIGITQNIEKRIAKHNQGGVRSTKSYRPLFLVYQENFAEKTLARKREIFLKSTAKARRELFTNIQHAPIV